MLLYSVVLTLTIALELAVASGWLLMDRDESDRRSVLLLVVGINLITHPIAWMAGNLAAMNFWMVEMLIMIAEALALWRLPGRRFWWAVGLSSAMNVVSMTAGLVIWMVGFKQ